MRGPPRPITRESAAFPAAEALRILHSTKSASSVVALPTAAEQIADRNFQANLEALSKTQPRVVEHVREVEAGLEWLFARDGSLTGMESDEDWYGGCSVPLGAARFMLKTMEAGGSVACFLSPTHAAQLRVALDMLRRPQAIIAIVPERRKLRIILQCGDFSTDIDAHRLWFASGDEWADELEWLLKESDGLPTPSQFIRPILADATAVDRLIAPAQRVFAAEISRRATVVQSTRENHRPRRNRATTVCVIAPTHFRLWDDAGIMLAATIDGGAQGATVLRIDTDDPTSASPVALARAAAECDAIVSADLYRGDVPGVVPDGAPWVTWVTRGRIPGRDTAGPRDALLVADPRWRSDAIRFGWPDDRVEVATWPQAPPHAAPAEPMLAVIADTRPLEPPQRVTDYSSHRLLWELIARELWDDPFLLHDEPRKYLDERMKKLAIAEEGFDRRLFLDAVVVPAYQQGLVRALVSERFPVQLFGEGWEQVPDLCDHAGGAVSTRQTLAEVLARSSAVVHVWPWRHAHPVDACSRPVLRRTGQRRESFLRDARLALTAPHTRQQQRNHLSAERVLSLLRR